MAFDGRDRVTCAYCISSEIKTFPCFIFKIRILAAIWKVTWSEKFYGGGPL